MAQSTPLFVGLDVHKDSIAVAHAAGDSTAPPVFVGAIGSRQADLDQLLRRLQGKAASLAVASGCTTLAAPIVMPRTSAILRRSCVRRPRSRSSSRRVCAPSMSRAPRRRESASWAGSSLTSVDT